MVTRWAQYVAVLTSANGFMQCNKPLMIVVDQFKRESCSAKWLHNSVARSSAATRVRGEGTTRQRLSAIESDRKRQRLRRLLREIEHLFPLRLQSGSRFQSGSCLSDVQSADGQKLRILIFFFFFLFLFFSYFFSHFLLQPKTSSLSSILAMQHLHRINCVFGV